MTTVAKNPPDERSARIEALLDDAVRWGLLEETNGDLADTRRWKNALREASFALAREAAECPTCPRPRDPVGECVRRALVRLEIPVPPGDEADVVALLTHFEIASMPEMKRAQNGYPEAWP